MGDSNFQERKPLFSAEGEPLLPPKGERPRFGVRIGRGIVMYWGNVPLTTWDAADECRKAISELTGESGDVEEVPRDL